MIVYRNVVKSFYFFIFYCAYWRSAKYYHTLAKILTLLTLQLTCIIHWQIYRGKDLDVVNIATECYLLGETMSDIKKIQKTALLSVLVNRFLPTKNEGPTCPIPRHGPTYPDMGQFTPTWANLSWHGAAYPNMGQLILTWGNLPRHGPTYPDLGQLTPAWATYPDMGQFTPTWGNVPRHGPIYPDMGQRTPTWVNLPRRGPTSPDIGQLTPT